jgi:dihydroorotate dehydrogenase
VSEIDLTTNIGKLLKLREPFWIASSHFTEKESILWQWAELEPAAITLKTCTCTDRTEKHKRSIRRKTLDIAPRYGRSYYCDGPKSVELHSYEEAAKLFKDAREILPKSKVGISVRGGKGEDYNHLLASCGAPDFVEVNLKYAMRLPDSHCNFFEKSAEMWAGTIQVVIDALEAFKQLPVFVKLPRELQWLPGTQQCQTLLEKLHEHGKAGLIVANSLKIDLADVIYENREMEFCGGVLMGDAL